MKRGATGLLKSSFRRIPSSPMRGWCMTTIASYSCAAIRYRGRHCDPDSPADIRQRRAADAQREDRPLLQMMKLSLSNNADHRSPHRPTALDHLQTGPCIGGIQPRPPHQILNCGWTVAAEIAQRQFSQRFLMVYSLSAGTHSSSSTKVSVLPCLGPKQINPVCANHPKM